MSDKNWRKHWNQKSYPAGENVFFRQVGKTVGGKPIGQQQFQRIIDDLIQCLQIQKDDIVLDLCCGNGLITRAVAEACNRVVGVDFSRPLISVAREHHFAANIEYVHSSVLELEAARLSYKGRFTKVYMYEALQYFNPDQFSQILRLLLEFSDEDVLILFGSVPDRKRKWHFYDTPRRKFEHFKRIMLGRENLGTWWEKSVISQACEQLGLACEFLPQHPTLHTAHYRFDVLVLSD